MLALAHGASQYNLTRPRMTEENIIDIKNCRHLLQEMTVPSYVANDAFIEGGRVPFINHGNMDHSERSPTLPSTSTPSQLTSSHSEPNLDPNPDPAPQGPSMLLLTGPNYSGKSIYLKSIAQTIYLSHLGSFVPCTSALVGLTPAILTRIRTCETVSRPHSAFMIDLQQVASILTMATRRSLVVIDEFGKGTEACDGAGLAAGVLQHLLGRREQAPKVLAATHFHEIFEAGFLPRQNGLGFAHMEVRVDEVRRRRVDDDEDERDVDGLAGGGGGAEVTYLYNLRPGRNSDSFGTQCAAMNGVPAAIVERASLLSRLALQGEDLVKVCAGVEKGEVEDLQRAEAVARGFLEWDLDEGSIDRVVNDDDGVGAGGGVMELRDLRTMLEGLVGESASGSGDTTDMTTYTATGTGTGMRSGRES